MMLDRTAILGKLDLKREAVAVPEWGDSVFIREMTAGERDEWESQVWGENPPHKDRLRAALVAYTLCDDKGVRLFTADDITALEKLGAAALHRVFEAAMRLNQLRKEDMEAVAKN